MNPVSTDRLWKSDASALAIITLLGLALRLFMASPMPLRGDEVGTWILMQRDYSYLFTTFFDPWLTMGPFIAFTKAWSGWVGEAPLMLRLPVIAAGAAAIPLAAGIVRHLGGDRSAARITALLVAVNPYLVLFGINLRSYAFLVLFTLGALHELLRFLESPSWRRGTACGACCAAALISHASTLYFLAFFPAVYLWRRREPGSHPLSARWWKDAWPLFVPVGIGGLLAAAVHLPILEQMAVFRHQWSDTPPVTPSYIPYALGSYLAPGWLVFPSLILLLTGWILTVRRHSDPAVILGSGLAIPVTLYAASGSAHFPWGSARFLIFLVPLLLMQIGMAVVMVTEKRGLRALLVVLVLATWFPGLRTPYRAARREPWADVAEELLAQLRERDKVAVAGNDRLILMPFFRERPHTLIAPSEYLHFAAAPAPDYRLFLVTRDNWITGEPSLRKGRLQVTRYAGETQTDIAAAFLRDLQNTAGGQAAPELAALLKEGLELQEQLEPESPGLITLQRIYYHSVLQSRSGMYMPAVQRRIRFP
jgi:hypothetical protein